MFAASKAGYSSATTDPSELWLLEKHTFTWGIFLAAGSSDMACKGKVPSQQCSARGVIPSGKKVQWGAL